VVKILFDSGLNCLSWGKYFSLSERIGCGVGNWSSICLDSLGGVGNWSGSDLNSLCSVLCWLSINLNCCSGILSWFSLSL